MKRNLNITIIMLVSLFASSFVACKNTDSESIKKSTAKDYSITSVKNTNPPKSATNTTKPKMENPVLATTQEQPTPAPITRKNEIREYTSIKDIVSLYNSCANKVKPDARIAIRNYQKLEPLADFSSSGLFSSVIEDNFYKGTITDPLICNTSALRKKHFPIVSKDYTSKLTPSMVSYASCTYKDGAYSLVIKLKDDPKGSQEFSSACLSVVTPKIIAENANISVIKEKNITATCKGCILKSRIDAKTGNMIGMYYKMPTYLTINVVASKNSFAFYVEQDWSINW
ncbi:MAG: hypothetical protein RR012_05280 [Oscillospiraceae bacterium]